METLSDCGIDILYVILIEKIINVEILYFDFDD